MRILFYLWYQIFGIKIMRNTNYFTCSILLFLFNQKTFIFHIYIHIFNNYQPKIKKMYKNLIKILFISYIFLSLAQSVRINKAIPLKDLAYSPQTIFLAKFQLHDGDGQVTARFSKFGEQKFDIKGLKFGILTQQKFQVHRKAQTCEQKQTFYRETHEIKFFNSREGVQILKLSKNSQKHSWFIYLYICDYIEFTGTGEDIGIAIDLLTFNKGAHFGQNKSLLWPYTLLCLVWAFSLYNLGNQIKASILNIKNIATNLLSVGYVMLGIAIVCKFFSIGSTVMTGEGIQFFNSVYIAFKASIEVIMATVLTAISWGWLLNSISTRNHYILITLLVTVLNIITLIISNSSSQEQSLEHLYQGFAGKIILFIRILISLIFLSGCLYVSLQFTDQRKGFINNFAKFGSLYLFSGLLSLVLAEIFAPSYMHAQIITFLQEFIRLIANTCMCWIFLKPSSNDNIKGRKPKGFNYFGQGGTFDQEYSLSGQNKGQSRDYQDN